MVVHSVCDCGFWADFCIKARSKSKIKGVLDKIHKILDYNITLEDYVVYSSHNDKRRKIKKLRQIDSPKIVRSDTIFLTVH